MPDFGDIFGDVADFVGGLVSGLSRNDVDRLKRYIAAAKEAAKRYGVPETLVIGVINAESGFEADPGGNGGGIGQFLPETAAAYGTNQEELRNDPLFAIDLVARLLADNAKYFAQDPMQWQKAAASYFIGPGNVQQASKTDNWIAAADQLAAQNRWGSVSDYLRKAGVSKPGRVQTIGPSGTPATKPAKPKTPGQMPNPSDYYIYDEESGEYVFDPSYWTDRQSALQSRIMEQELNLGPAAQYMEDLIKQMELEISAGTLSLNKASELLDARLEGFQTAQEAYSSTAFTRGAAVGAQYLPRGGPGDYYANIGLAPSPIQGGVTMDPFQEALNIYRQAEGLVGNINVPRVPNIATSRGGAITPPAFNEANIAPAASAVTPTPSQSAFPPGMSVDDILQRALAEVQGSLGGMT